MTAEAKESVKMKVFPKGQVVIPVSLRKKYHIDIEIIEKPKDEYMTDEYFELDLPVAPAVMVAEQIVVEGSDIAKEKLEAVICRHLGLPQPE